MGRAEHSCSLMLLVVAPGIELGGASFIRSRFFLPWGVHFVARYHACGGEVGCVVLEHSGTSLLLGTALMSDVQLVCHGFGRSRIGRIFCFW